MIDLARKFRQPTRAVLIFFFGCLICAAASCRKNEPPAKPPVTQPDPLKEAISKVEEARGEPTGRKAQVVVPGQLQHYSDRRRFLAIQQAAWSERNFERPQGYLELLDLIEKGALVEMESLGENYLLYGVGDAADIDFFAYYDRVSEKNIRLFANQTEWLKGKAELEKQIEDLQVKVLDLQTQFSLTSDPALRNNLSKQISEIDKVLTELNERRDLLISFYDDAIRREMLFARYAWLSSIAAKFRGRAYDLEVAPGRREFKMKLLSFIRPEARATILQIAAAYKEKFGRHLPITSLIRTVEYQQRLREVNPNATTREIAPHTTGLAFDIYDGWMDATEQTFLMNLIASLESAGSVEALRENRNHIHVFTLPNGKLPDATRINKALGK
ncbi:MAG: DUF5715 family protein [Acidobacteriota bacterium]